MLLAACGQKAARACRADDQNACLDSSLTYDAGIGDIFDTRKTRVKSKVDWASEHVTMHPGNVLPAPIEP